MNNIIRLKVANKTYGGYEYLEINTITNQYRKGSSRSHTGYSNALTDVEVKNKKELKLQEEILLNRGFIKKESSEPF